MSITSITEIFPYEIHLNLLSMIPAISFLPRLARVCKTWQVIIARPYVWKTVHCRMYSADPDHWLGPEIKDWRKHSIEVFKIVREFWQKNTRSPNNYITLATRLYKEKYLNESICLLSDETLFGSEEANNISRRCHLADILLKLKMFEKCEKLIDPLLVSMPPNLKAYTRRGDIALEQDRMDQAERYYGEAAVGPHGRIKAKLGLMEAYKRQGKQDLYINLRDSIEPEHELITNILIAQYHAVDSLEDGLDSAKAAEKEGEQVDLAAFIAARASEIYCKRSFRWAQNRSKSHIVDSETKDVKEHYQTSLNNNPFNLRVIFCYVDFLQYEIELRKQSEVYFRPNTILDLREKIRSLLLDAVRLNPGYALTYFLLGKILLDMGQDNEALKMLSEAKKRGYEDKELYFLEIQLNLKKNDFIRAENLCRECLNKFPSREATLLFGQTIASQLDSISKAEAEELLKKQVLSDAKDLDGWILLGRLQEAQSKHEEALKSYQIAHELFTEQNRSTGSVTTIEQNE